MGSGHILVYAFEVLMEIYKECGYGERDAVAEILQNNLFGLDIDERCSQLAYFAVMMKARSYDRRFLSRGIEPQVYYPQKDADLVQFCSLLQVKDPGKKPREPEELTLFYQNYEVLLNDWNCRRLLSQKYAVVCTNPPYLNRYDAALKKFVTERYKDYSRDQFSVFTYRNFDFCKQGGYSALMTPNVWMFIKSYEKLRGYIIRNKWISGLVQMAKGAFFKEATVDICSFIFQNAQEKAPGLYFRLEDFKGDMEVQREKVLEAIANPNCGYFYETQQSNFSKIPGSPVAYWVSEGLLVAFATGKSLSELALARNGMKTGENERFVRLWWEVIASSLNLRAKDWKEAVASNAKWFPYNKGGEYRKWYGNNDCIVNWKNQGNEIFNLAKVDKRNVQDYPLELKFVPSVSWSLVTSGQPAFRYKIYNLSDIAGMSFFTSEPDLSLLLGFCNSKVALNILTILAPTINFQAGDIGRLPIVEYGEKANSIYNLVSENIKISCSDWDSYETSWDFKKHPLV